MNLVIDEGNSRIKLAVFCESQLVDYKVSNVSLFEKEIYLLLNKHNIESAIISSVTDKVLKIFLLLALENKIVLDKKVPLPFKNLYKTPNTLGVDRLALATAAFNKFNHKNTLVIDAGTCITYDFINDEGEYLGGGISPGIQMRFNAMNHFTEKLPQISTWSTSINLVGDSTNNSMFSGVIYGTVFEVDGMIAEYTKKYRNINVILTGGDANFLFKKLKNSIFVNLNFLLEGLNDILTYQLHQ